MKKTVSEINPDHGYRFLCMWDENIDIEKEIEEAQKQCNTPEVQCYHPPKEHFAIAFGRSDNDEQTDAAVERLHSYLLIHGWEQSVDGGKMKTQKTRRTLSKVRYGPQ